MTTEKQILNYIELNYPDEEIIYPEGFERAFVGVTADGDSIKAVMSVNKCIDILAEDMPRQEADEHFWFNVAGSYMGANSPTYIYTIEELGDLSPYE
tara:strand:+ start:38702 stop:38992 length:291 start_codon:yes stop_codon:yes gene_type:complete